ncbi:MAG: sulfatase-like hydrolase/transferase [Opitutaceae bacterium]|nr:sulfatase-like hydrolase/transferase [Opitutaceae bacterium]
MLHLRFHAAFLAVLMRLGFLLLGLGLMSRPLLAAPATPSRPNFLFIIVDDQSPFDLKAYNSKTTLETPVIDRLAAQGMTIDGAHHMGAFIGGVCTPSRHMVMSGRTLWHLPATLTSRVFADYRSDLCPPGLEQNTIPAVFNRAGYDTMRTCKIGNSYEAANQLFQVRKDASKNGPTDETGSAWHAERVLEYLADRTRSGDRDPFLIYFGFTHPHDPRNGKPELLQKYGAVNHTDPGAPPPANPHAPPLPPSYLPEHPFAHGHPNLRDEVAVQGVWERRDAVTMRNELGRHHACSENIDIQIGRVLDRLEAMGELDNTYVFYTSDHGIAIGRHGLQGKQNLYEHTWRVPFIVKGPRIKAGMRARGNIYLLDVLATLCDLAGIAPPESNEGLSFRPVLEGRRDVVREVVYGAYCGGTKPGIRSVKRGDWKLIKYDVLGGQVRETQLFNLAENPEEFLVEHHAVAVRTLTGHPPNPDQVNLARDPRYAGRRKEMEALLLAEEHRLHDPYRMWDQPGDGLTPPKEALPVRPAKKK